MVCKKLWDWSSNSVTSFPYHCNFLVAEHPYSSNLEKHSSLRMTSVLLGFHWCSPYCQVFKFCFQFRKQEEIIWGQMELDTLSWNWDDSVWVFWDITLSSMEKSIRCSRGKCCFHIQGQRLRQASFILVSWFSHFQPWTWKWYVPLKCHSAFTGLHGIISQ